MNIVLNLIYNIIYSECTHTYMQSIIINETRGHEFEGERRGDVRVLKEEGKERNVITIL